MYVSICHCVHMCMQCALLNHGFCLLTFLLMCVWVCVWVCLCTYYVFLTFLGERKGTYISWVRESTTEQKLIPLRSFMMKQWVQSRLRTGAWMRVCTQENGKLECGYTSGDKASPFSFHQLLTICKSPGGQEPPWPPLPVVYEQTFGNKWCWMSPSLPKWQQLHEPNLLPVSSWWSWVLTLKSLAALLCP